MAKKKTKKAKPATVASIIKECRAQVMKGLGKKRLSLAALKYWRDGYKVRVGEKLLKSPGEWEKDRRRVLPVAKKLGKVAAALSTGNIVLLWAAEAAAIAVKSDPGCPAIGSGGYCDPPPNEN